MLMSSGLSIRSSAWEVFNAVGSFRNLNKIKKNQILFLSQLLSVSFYYILARLCTCTISYEPLCSEKC